MLQAKGPIRAPFCQWAAVCLCAEQATAPFSSVCVCVYNSPSVHTLTHILPLSTLLSLSPFLTFCIFQSHVLPVFCCYLSFCPTNTVALFLSLVLWPEALCKATREGLLAMPVCASILLSIHFRSFPFFSVTCSHNCCCFRRTETHIIGLRELKINTLVI